MHVKSERSDVKYTIELTEDEAMYLHDFLTAHCNSRLPDGKPAFEIQIANGLYEEGLSVLFERKWKKEYDIPS